MKTGKLQNLRTGLIVGECVWKADRFWPRLRGLLGRTGLAQGEGLWLSPCRQVHMFGMQFAISVWYLDNTGRICGLIDNLEPWAISPYMHSAASVIEFPAGWGSLKDTRIGDELAWEEKCAN